MLREDQKDVQALIGTELAIDSCIKRRRRLAINFLWNSSSRKSCLWKFFSALNSATYFGWIQAWMYPNCQNHCFIVAHKWGFLCMGASKTPDSFNFLRRSGKILLTLSGILHVHENSSQSLLFEYETLWPPCCSKHSCSHDAKGCHNTL